ncbi:hypothetical protein DRQ53_07760 [bacterium]|nr:MAG: hypothetical protein DRQ53_07760 [bacterium]
MRFAPSVLVAAFVCLHLVPAQAYEPQNIYELPLKGGRQLQTLQDAGYDVLGIEDGKVRVVGGESDVAFFESTGAPVTLHTPASPVAARRSYGPDLDGYHTYAEMEVALQDLVASFPSICALSIIGTSIEGRNIYALKISDNVAQDEPEPEVLIMGNLHAREVMSVEVPLAFAEHLVNEYGSDPQVTAMVDAREVFILPMVNPDGHVYVENNNADDWWTWWRKNRRDNGDGTVGVDLNRNFGYEWGYDDIGSSPTTSSLVYRGPSAFSEPETQAIRDFSATRDFSVAFSYHSYSELLLYPWGYSYSYTADHELFHALGQDLTSTNGYFPGNPAEGAIYIVNGDSDDWCYGDSTTKNSFLGFTPELNSSAQGGFGPPDTMIQPTVDLMLPMNMRLLELAAEPRKVLGPIIPSMQAHAWNAPTLTLNWSGDDPLDPNPVTSWDVEQLIDLHAEQLDPAEAIQDYWSPTGWTQSTIAFEGAGSYYSGAGDNLKNLLTLSTPYEVTANTQIISCQLNYDIEIDYDYAYLEVSEDGGLIWQTVPGSQTTNTDPNAANRGNGITGSSGGWVASTFDLSSWLGQTVQLRFVYSTDGSVQGDGIRIDTIGPVFTAASRQIVASGLSSNTVELAVAQIARYSHRVRATDAEGDVSRWSILQSVQLDPVTATEIPLRHISAIHPNYPNPFNPRTLIPFTIGGAEGDRSVSMAVYNMAGLRIRTLVEMPMAVGSHRIAWDGVDGTGTAVASGVYFVRLEVDGRVEGSRKIALLK